MKIPDEYQYYLDIIDELNDKIIDSYPNHCVGNDEIGFYPRLDFYYTTYNGCGITFCEICLWSEANDERPYVSVTHDKMPLREFLIDRIKLVIATLNKINLVD